jgi:long-subunit acyl-CoA synthetase (AMP-forming)
MDRAVSNSARRRPALEAATLCEAFQITAAERAGQVAHRTFGGGVEFTFAEYAARVQAIAAGLHTLGVGRGDTLALMLVNRPEFNLADTAAVHLGAIPFSVYNTSSPEQIAQVFLNAQSRVVVTERRFLPNVLAARTPGLEHIVLVDGAEPGTRALDELAQRRARGFDFEAAWRAVEPDDVVTLIYTSGTTGPPKAAQLTHGSVMFESRALTDVLPLSPGGRGISYLPCAHVGERVVTHYCSSICCGTTVTSVADHRQIGAALAEIHPTAFGAVPRVWEKLKASLETAGLSDPSRLPDSAKAAVRARIGLDQVGWCISSAAPIATDVLGYFGSLGLPLNEGWGMSELSCFATMSPPDDIRIGTVGKALPGVELRVLDDGELLVRAPLVMKGYRGDPVRTAEALDAEGWLHSGDIARIDGDGYVTIVDRKKEIIINSAGKNMSPANIEQQLRAASPLIAYAACIGDRRPYNVALLVLDTEVSARYGAHEIRAACEAAVEAANARLSRVEQIKRFAILAADWQPGGDELTPTSKLKRRVILEKYRSVIEGLY